MTAAFRQAAFLFCCVVATFLLATASDARDVRVGVFVTSLSGIDPSDGSFRIEGYAWFIDPAGTFEPDRDLQIIARSSSWRSIAAPGLGDGATYTVVRFGALVNQAFEIHAYPFDSQSLRLSVEAADVETGIAIRDGFRLRGFRRRLDCAEVLHSPAGTSPTTRDSSCRRRGDGLGRDLLPLLRRLFLGDECDDGGLERSDAHKNVVEGGGWHGSLLLLGDAGVIDGTISRYGMPFILPKYYQKVAVSRSAPRPASGSHNIYLV